MPAAALDVGVVIARRKAASPWADHVWEAHAVLPDPAEAAPGARIGGDEARALFYAGAATIEAHPAHAGFYRENLLSGAPRLWVVLRPGADGAFPELVKVTCDPTEGEGFSETGWDIVSALPMPPEIESALAAFVAEHYVEQPFVKRKRDRQDPEALAAGRRGPERDRFLRELKQRETDG